jgi:endonuclease YncB( thermonuclease family)
MTSFWQRLKVYNNCHWKISLAWAAATLMAAMGLVAGVAAEVFEARATAVPDGDTLWVQPQAGGAPVKLRLLGLDAPEICQTGGVAARYALRELVDQTDLIIEVKYQDAYGRGLARIQARGQDVGSVMVGLGMAWSNRWRRSLGPYAAQEHAAQRDHLGLFGQNEPELPSDFRKRHGSCYESTASGAFKLEGATHTGQVGFR